MARVCTELRCETDAVRDAIDLFAAAMAAVATRHGERFREFERRLEALLEADLEPPTMVNLGDGIFAAEAPASWSLILRDARDLGLIS
jgi:hypothetical protein